MLGRHDQRVGQLVFVPDRSAPGRAPHDRNTRPARVGPGFSQTLKIPQTERRDRPAVRSQECRIGTSGNPIQQRLVERHVSRSIGNLVGKHAARGHVSGPDHRRDRVGVIDHMRNEFSG